MHARVLSMFLLLLFYSVSLFLFLMLSKGEIDEIDAECTGELCEEISRLRNRCWMYGGALLSLHHLLPKLLTIGLPSSKGGVCECKITLKDVFDLWQTQTSIQTTRRNQ